MGINVLGISGSPIKDSNTDRLVKNVLAATGVESEFVKLSTINVRPCLCLELRSVELPLLHVAHRFSFRMIAHSLNFCLKSGVHYTLSNHFVTASYAGHPIPPSRLFLEDGSENYS